MAGAALRRWPGRRRIVVCTTLASERQASVDGEGLLRNAGHVHSGRVDLEMWSLVVADLH